MKNKVFWFIFSIICLLGFTAKVEASAPSKLNTGSMTKLEEYVAGYPIWLKPTSDNNHHLYCEVSNLLFPSNKTITLNSEVDKGFVYILNNKPNTGNSNKNYYIMQQAVWWYKDVLNGNNDNLSANFKTYCTNNRTNHDVCNRIYNLVEGAKKYSEPKGSISFSKKSIDFTESGSYYVSDKITVSTTNLKSLNYLKLVDAPKNAQIINDNVSSLNGTGTFQVRVPKSSISSGTTATFSVEASGAYHSYSAYDYYYGAAYQKVIYDVVYHKSHPTSDSITLRISKESPTTTKKVQPLVENSLIIYKVDQDGNNLRGATLTLYEGNCLNKTCLTKDIYTSWTTTKNPKEFTDISTGYYTLVETETPEGYETADKALIYVRYDDEAYNYTMVNVKEGEVKPVKISKKDITGANEVLGATLIVKNASGKEVANWVSGVNPKQLILEAGKYTLIEKYAPAGYKLTSTTIYFKVDKLGNVEVKNELGKYIPVEMVTITNEPNDIVSISKLDSSTNSYLKGATLVLKNEKGEIVTTWTTTDESYGIALNAGYYTIYETQAPTGYEINTETISIRVLEDGTLMVKNSEGNYEIASGIIIYNKPVLEEETIIVPKTGLSSVLTYTFGSFTLLSGAYLLMKNGQFSL